MVPPTRAKWPSFLICPLGSGRTSEGDFTARYAFVSNPFKTDRDVSNLGPTMDAKPASGRSLFRAWVATFALCTLGASVPCFATLGGDLSSVQQDRAHLKASLRVSPSTGYSVHELKAA